MPLATAWKMDGKIKRKAREQLRRPLELFAVRSDGQTAGRYGGGWTILGCYLGWEVSTELTDRVEVGGSGGSEGKAETKRVQH